MSFNIYQIFPGYFCSPSSWRSPGAHWNASFCVVCSQERRHVVSDVGIREFLTSIRTDIWYQYRYQCIPHQCVWPSLLTWHTAGVLLFIPSWWFYPVWGCSDWSDSLEESSIKLLHNHRDERVTSLIQQLVSAPAAVERVWCSVEEQSFSPDCT